ACAMRLRLNSSAVTALPASMPLIMPATSASLRGLVRRLVATARASVSAWRPGCFDFAMALLPLRLLVGAVAVEGARRRELAELVPHHVLGHVDRHVLLAVVDGEGQADEIGHDRRAPRPGLDDLVTAAGARLLDLVEHVAVD